MLDKYIYGADAVLFVYDMTNYQSFENVEDWVKCVKDVAVEKEADKKKKLHLSLVANKGDLDHMRTVNKANHEKYATENRMTSYVVSAKTGDSVATTFKKIAAEILNIKLSSLEIEADKKVVKAELPRSGKSPADRSSSSKMSVRSKKKKPKSSICVVQ